METLADATFILKSPKRNTSFQMNFRDAVDAHFEINFSASFHNPEKLWTLINYFGDTTN